MNTLTVNHEIKISIYFTNVFYRQGKSLNLINYMNNKNSNIQKPFI